MLAIELRVYHGTKLIRGGGGFTNEGAVPSYFVE